MATTDDAYAEHAELLTIGIALTGVGIIAFLGGFVGGFDAMSSAIVFEETAEGVLWKNGAEGAFRLATAWMFVSAGGMVATIYGAQALVAADRHPGREAPY